MRGHSVTLNGAGFVAGEDVNLTLPSSTVQPVVADANGGFTATVVVPATTPLGAAKYTAEGVGSGRTAEASISVVAATGVVPVSNGVKGGGLAVTGLDTGLMIPFTLLALLAGGALLLAPRRKRALGADVE